jgi:hypothetical protein
MNNHIIAKIILIIQIWKSKIFKIKNGKTNKYNNQIINHQNHLN